jgi:peptidoglycan/xylan/chitin deacetylase (PgdA/CDA1 family)
MSTVVSKLIRRAADEVAIRSGWAQRRFAAQSDCIRVLTYHGLVPDELADCPWVPSHFLSVSQFERQMEVLVEFGPIVPLGEAYERIINGNVDEPLICLTFDDGTADNTSLVLPILKRYGYRASFFLATGLIDRGAMMSCNMIRLLADLQQREGLAGTVSQICRRLLAEPGLHKQLARHSYQGDLDDLWKRNCDRIHPDAIDSLRMMTWDDARLLHKAGMEIGAHTMNHIILGKEGLVRRRSEISGSIARVQEELGVQRVPFSYPNGQDGDFSGTDQEILAALNAPYAVRQSPGRVEIDTPQYALPRYSISRHCGDRAFMASIFGLRDEAETPAVPSAFVSA